jgi:hypothetical protein
MTIDTFIVQKEKDDSAVRDSQRIASSAKWVLKFLQRYSLHTNIGGLFAYYTLFALDEHEYATESRLLRSEPLEESSIFTFTVSITNTRRNYAGICRTLPSNKVTMTRRLKPETPIALTQTLSPNIILSQLNAV